MKFYFHKSFLLPLLPFLARFCVKISSIYKYMYGLLTKNYLITRFVYIHSTRRHYTVLFWRRDHLYPKNRYLVTEDSALLFFYSLQSRIIPAYSLTIRCCQGRCLATPRLQEPFTHQHPKLNVMRALFDYINPLFIFSESEAYSEPYQTSKMEGFEKIVVES